MSTVGAYLLCKGEQAGEKHRYNCPLM